MTVLVPSAINTVFNVLIFMHVRASTRRVQPQTISAIASDGNKQQQRISRRDISLLQQMILNFCIFTAGWTPVYFILIIDHYIEVDTLIVRYTTIVGGLAVLAIIINLFLYNHEIKEYLTNKIRQSVQC